MSIRGGFGATLFFFLPPLTFQGQATRLHWNTVSLKYTIQYFR